MKQIFIISLSIGVIQSLKVKPKFFVYDDIYQLSIVKSQL